ncbi:uncharacterized protein MONOS_781 [Monocercomonoides exilis]|uniref:uncharacterized protein n=1 Tax=Monocercomonoides exilis TaxID=2049356 RepID=UPI003559A50B|nr:hypothetical protein MONOS_781 [Monocercomonoides exilis]|eukprot:MONOS_781.1-p1 / transcript=MONOS_781.1 / gene=MONOS_781 / organism=Monocercomonoides_exilis_PA203 / gene_product=unspecified product / transcript_product=unspecified product / location=Mono_scaffold00013:84281-84877(-) / protein_length=199 / sequence_SO=supercontig / SO=protein_coding / is_pseudo=false
MFIFNKLWQNKPPPSPLPVQEHLSKEHEVIARFAFVHETQSAPPGDDPPFESFHSHHSKRWLFASKESSLPGFILSVSFPIYTFAAFGEERVWRRKEVLKAEREVDGLLRLGMMAPSMGLWVWMKMVEWMEREERRENEGIALVLEFVVVVVVVVVVVMVVVVVNGLCGCVDSAGMVCVDSGAVVMFVKSVFERRRSR